MEYSNGSFKIQVWANSAGSMPANKTCASMIVWQQTLIRQMQNRLLVSSYSSLTHLCTRRNQWLRLGVVDSNPTYVPTCSFPKASASTYCNKQNELRQVNVLPAQGKILENLCLCSEVHFIRYTQEGKKRGKDPQLHIQDLAFEGIPVRIYQPRGPEGEPGRKRRKRRGVLFFHGGGWMFGSINSYDHVCRYISKESDSVIVSVGYHLAPEQKYPSQFKDCLAASIHFLKTAEDYGVDPARVVLSGDSVGGNLAASVCQALSSRSGLTKPCAQILIYPGLQAIDFNLPSYQQNRAVPILYREHVVCAALQYLNKDLSVLESVMRGCHVPSDIKTRFGKWINPENIPEEFKARGYTPPSTTTFLKDVYEVVKQALETTFSPLMAEDAVLGRLPRTCLITCEYDVLRDDGILYKKRLEENGVPVTWFHIENGFHGVINLFDGFLSFPSGKRGLNSIVSFLESL